MLMWEQLRKIVCGQMKNMLSKEKEMHTRNIKRI